MKVSIIVPVYNVEKYLKQCMDSLVGQSLEEIEIWAVDDGSSDKSWEILQEYAERYPDKVVVMQKENGGQASARNMALDKIQGDYVGFVDSDDWVDNNMYKRMYEKAVEEKSDIVVCDMVDHFPDYELYHHSSRFEDRFKVTPSACNKLFKRELIEKDRFPHGLWYEDFEFTTKQLMKTEKISVIHEGFYHCHCRPVSTMNNENAEKNLDMLQVFEHFKEYVIEKGWEDKYKETVEYLMLDHILITSINRLARQKNSQRKVVIETMITYVRNNYPNFQKDEVFLKMPRNRRFIACLNAKGHYNLSRMILETKEKLRR